MKSIGLIGGMSWESSAEYYRLINQETKRRLGGHHNARSIMLTVDFAEIEHLQSADRWPEMGCLLSDAARRIERAGADVIVLCTNTMHKVAGEIGAAVRIPMLHIADAVGRALLKAGQKRVGLLGTRFTMEQSFYSDRIRDGFGIEVVTPCSVDRARIHDVIYNELCHGIIREESRVALGKIIARMASESGADSVILGCTEIGLLISQGDSCLPVYDSAAIHASAAVDFAQTETAELCVRSGTSQEWVWNQKRTFLSLNCKHRFTA